MNYQVYFQKASLKSYVSLQVVVGVCLFCLMLFEGALASLNLFLYAVPLLSFTVMYVLILFYPVALPLVSIFIITILQDIFFTSLQNSQTFAILISLIIMKRVIVFPEQREFLEHWQGFGIAMAILFGIQSAFYMLWELSFVNWQGVLFQFGVSLLIYPFVYVVIHRSAQAFVDASER